MKKEILWVGLLICLSSSKLAGSTIYFSKATPGAGTAVVAIKLEDSEFKPIVVGWPAVGIDMQIVVKSSKKISSHIPSILLGNNSSELLQGDSLLHIDGKDISYSVVDLEKQQLKPRHRWEDELEGQWIKSRWLDWVFAGNYPKVLSAEKGWLYIENTEEEKYWIYSYADESWELMDLSLWKKTIFEFSP